MDELIKTVSEKAGINPEQAKVAVTSVERKPNRSGVRVECARSVAILAATGQITTLHAHSSTPDFCLDLTARNVPLLSG